jgi:O-antigen/teichoic acid export membrane protein
MASSEIRVFSSEPKPSLERPPARNGQWFGAGVVTWVVKRLTKSEFARNASLLFTGTLLAQAVPALISPILTRLYSPSEFGAFALFTSIASLIGIIGTGRYEFATLLPTSLKGASAVTGLVFAISGIVGILAFVFFTINTATAWIKTPDLGPLTAAFFGIYPLVFGASQALNYQRNRIGDFKKIAISRVAQSLTAGFVQISGGVLGLKSVALVIGSLLGQATCATVLAVKLPLDKRALNGRTIMRQARRFWKFPVYSLPGDLVNTVAQQVPVFLLAAKFGVAAAGFYGLTQRVLGVPFSLLATTVADVFKSQATRDFTRTGSCRRIYVKCFFALGTISLFLFGSFALFAPRLFSLFFGQKWAEAGEYARILSLMYVVGFVANPLSYTFYVVELQWVALVWQITLCAVVSAAIWFAPSSGGPKIAILWFATGYAAMYLIYLALSFYFSERKTFATSNSV